MRILFTAYSGLGIGGAEISMKLLAEGLKERGHNVVIASTGDYEGFRTYKFKCFRKIPLFSLHNLYLSRFLINVIKKEGIKIIHAHDRLTIPAAIIAAKKTGIKSVIHFRDYWFMCPKSSCLKPDYRECYFCSLQGLISCSSFSRLSWNLYKYYYLKSLKYLLKQADLKVAISKIIRDKLSLYNINSVVFSNPIEIKKQGEERHNGIVIGFAGSLDYHKGIFNVLKIAKEFRDILFLVVGKGPLEDKIKFYIKNNGLTNVTLLGYLDYKNMEYFYKKLDVLIVPSLWNEPFGRVAIEAMAHSKPVVGSNVGGLREIIISGRTGYLVEPNDLNDWFIKLNKLVVNNLLRSRMGNYAFKKAKERYDYSLIAGRYLSLLKNEKVN